LPFPTEAQDYRGVLTAGDVSVRFGGATILDRVSLTVEPGRVLGLLGPSGAGKTTLFRVLVGELRPASGTVSLAGADVTLLPLWQRARRGVGYVPQGPSVLGDLSVRENVRTFEAAVGATRIDPAERAREVGLEHRLQVRARELSGGEQRRLSVLRALIAEPRWLVVDEPFAGVDPLGAEMLVHVLQGRARAGCGILLADHRAKETLAVSDAVALLADGRVELQLEPEVFVDHPTVRARYMV
jgi:lipopolysaccharide export system ATP-binding protein